MATRAHQTTTRRNANIGPRPPRRKASSIRDESAYIAETKRRLGDPEALLAHLAKRPVVPGEETIRALIMQLLLVCERALPLSRFLSGLLPLLKRSGEATDALLHYLRSVDVLGKTEHKRPTITTENALLTQIALLPQNDAERIAAFFNNGVLDLFQPQLLDHFRMLATIMLRSLGYRDRQIAELVDEGDVDRTRKRRLAAEVIVNSFGPPARADR